MQTITKSFVFTENQIIPLEQIGKFISIIDADSTVQVKFDEDYEFVDLEKGMTLVNAFERVRLKSATAQTVKFMIGQNLLLDNRTTFSGSVSASIEYANDNTTIADGTLAAATQVQVAAADSDRIFAIIQALDTNSDDLRVGDSNTGATRGSFIKPGGSMILPTQTAIYLFNTDASNSAKYTYSEFKRV